MKKINQLTTDYENCIALIEAKELPELEQLKEQIRCAKKYIQKLRILVRSTDFSSIEEEIYFFKRVKPKLSGELRFLKKKQSYLLDRPTTSCECQEQYIRKELARLEEFKLNNITFFRYMKRGDSFYDDKYFVRLLEQLELFDDTDISELDPEFNTSHDFRAARIYSYSKLTVFYKEELEDLLAHKNISDINSILRKKNLKWTASKTDFIELIYSLQRAKAINSGDSSIKDLMNSFGKVFEIDLGNYYKTYAEIKNRNSDRTKFLQKLSESLVNNMDEENL